jgi:hypothetical protein
MMKREHGSFLGLRVERRGLPEVSRRSK